MGKQTSPNRKPKRSPHKPSTSFYRDDKKEHPKERSCESCELRPSSAPPDTINTDTAPRSYEEDKMLSGCVYFQVLFESYQPRVDPSERPGCLHCTKRARTQGGPNATATCFYTNENADGSEVPSVVPHGTPEKCVVGGRPPGATPRNVADGPGERAAGPRLEKMEGGQEYDVGAGQS